ncbi:hypothetical protein Fmac_014199 [Flemingia macrophylla]|uniref:Uncharacterized protein n=1 Tax=Flemingia macrophylla TaxID=520843 RepID=A0ABD1MB36_9FABA
MGRHITVLGNLCTRNKKFTPQKHPSYSTNITWFYTVTKAISTGRQPLVKNLPVIGNYV